MDTKNKTLTGLKWTTYSTIFLAVTEILKISIITRLIEKKDFGLMAIVLFIISFLSLFNDMGISTAILHKQNISKKQYSSLYWLNWIISFLVYALLLLITPLTSNFYNLPALNILIPLVGLNIFFVGLGSQFRIIEQKNLLYKDISIIEIVSSLVSFLAAIYFAYNDYKVYTLVYSLIIRVGLSNCLFFIMGYKKYGLLVYYKFHDTTPFLKIGIYQVGSQIINYFNRDIDVLIIGKLFSTEVLGGYSLAKELVRKPTFLFNSIINKVYGSSLARFNYDNKLLKIEFLKLTNITSSLAIPLYIFILFFSAPIINIVYGSNYADISTQVKVLSVYMIFRTVGANIGNLIVATGRTDLDFNWNLYNFFVTPLFIYIGCFYGITGVAIAITINAIVLYIPSYLLLVKPLFDNITLLEYTKSFFLIKKPHL